MSVFVDAKSIHEEGRIMKTIKLGFFLLLLFAGMAIVPLVSAEKVGSLPSHNSDQFMEWAYTMEGKEVTAAQCLERSSPEYWTNLTNEKRSAYSEIKVVLPNFHQFKQNADAQSATASSITSDNDQNARAIIYTATANSATSVIPFGINYWASTATTPVAFPVTNVIADLMRWDGSRWVSADQGTATGYFTSFVEVWKNKFFPQSECYYITYSQHYGDFPPGTIPPAYYITKWSNQIYYS